MSKPKLMDFFQVVNEEMVFTGNHLEVRIPIRYKVHDMLIVENYVRSLAIFELVVNKEFTYGMILPCIIQMEPSQTSRATINEIEYQICEFYNGDKFLTSIVALREPHIAAMMYKEFISLGNLPEFLSYDTTANLFDTAETVCDINLHTPHAIFEMIYSFLFRDPDNLYTKYRFTDKTKKPAFIGTTSVAFGPESTTSKLIGAYFNDGINSALVNAADKRSDLEDLLRK